MLTPVRNGILFAFYDETTKKGFLDTSEGGIILGRESVDQMMNKARWGKVLAIGPDVKEEISVGDAILIAPLKWTTGFDHDGVRIWKTDDEQILALKD